MSIAGGNNRIKYCGESPAGPLSGRGACVEVDGVRFRVRPETVSRFQSCTNLKEYTEAIQYFTYLVLEKRTLPNDGWLGRYPPV